MTMKYYLVRDEVASLFIIGKALRSNPNVNPDILHTMCVHLTKPNPHLQLLQVKWWYVQGTKVGITIPQWLAEAFAVTQEDNTQ